MFSQQTRTIGCDRIRLRTEQSHREADNRVGIHCVIRNLKVSSSSLTIMGRVTGAHGERVKLEAPLWSSGCEWGGIALSVAIMNRGVCRPDPALTRAIPCA